MLDTYQKEAIAELVNEFATGEANGYYGDRLGELVDNFLPIYNSDIIKEWQEMPSGYDNEGANMFGMPEEVDIFSLMTLDLLNYIGELVSLYAQEYAETVDVDLSDFA
jgi:hypothetical protein